MVLARFSELVRFWRGTDTAATGFFTARRAILVSHGNRTSQDFLL
jgi:hypothetical protein